ncbi:EpsG family protein [Bacteroidia bacterium]|nr:EpsG family protein [Bacteroidia bacterium]
MLGYNIAWFSFGNFLWRKLPKNFLWFFFIVLLIYYVQLPLLGDVRNSYQFQYIVSQGIRNFEPLYLLLLFIANSLGIEAAVFFAAIRVLMIVWIWRIEKDIAVVLFWLYSSFFFLSVNNVIRQGIGMIFLYQAYTYVKGRRWLMALVLVALAQGFHSSSLYFAGIILGFEVCNNLYQKNGRFYRTIYIAGICLVFIFLDIYEIYSLPIRNNERFSGVLKPILVSGYFFITTKHSRSSDFNLIRQLFYYLFMFFSLYPSGVEMASRVLLYFYMLDVIIVSKYSTRNRHVYLFILYSMMNIAIHVLLNG